MRGRRVYPSADGRLFLEKLEPGDYWFHDGTWACMLPNGIRCGLRNHTVTEHADGTISVCPSILMTCAGAPEWDWHGWLRGGVFESA